MGETQATESAATCFEGNERLREFIDFLHEQQISQHHIDLPQIAVMGDTSSGKSSLLSAISQIQLPSNDQLTTRCPLRLRMARSESEKACVAVQWHASSSYAVRLQSSQCSVTTVLKMVVTPENLGFLCAPSQSHPPSDSRSPDSDPGRGSLSAEAPRRVGGDSG